MDDFYVLKPFSLLHNSFYCRFQVGMAKQKHFWHSYCSLVLKLKLTCNLASLFGKIFYHVNSHGSTMQTLDYKIIYSKRRSVSLAVTAEGEVVVRAPKYISLNKIEELLEQKKGWIFKHVEKRKKYLPVKKQYREGEKFWFLGKDYELKILEGYRSKIEFDNAFYVAE